VIIKPTVHIDWLFSVTTESTAFVPEPMYLWQGHHGHHTQQTGISIQCTFTFTKVWPISVRPTPISVRQHI